MEFQEYQRISKAQLRPYIIGEDLAGVFISPENAKAGSPQQGDMIARNPDNHSDQWLVSKAYFNANFAPVTITKSVNDRIKEAASEAVLQAKNDKR